MLNSFLLTQRQPLLLELVSFRHGMSRDTTIATGRRQYRNKFGVEGKGKATSERTVPSTTTAFHQTHSSSSSDHSLLSLSRQIGQGLSPRPPAGGTGTFFFMSAARSIELPAVPFAFVGEVEDPPRSEGSEAKVGEDTLSEVYHSYFRQKNGSQYL